MYPSGSFAGDLATDIYKDATLTAVWEISKYTVTFDGNGESVSPSSKTVTYGSTYGDLPTPTREGYVFIGWFDETTSLHDSSKTYKDNPLNYYADTNIDLYNVFGYNASSLYYHYIVNGKNEERTLSQYISTNTVTITCNKTLYAGWLQDIVTSPTIIGGSDSWVSEPVTIKLSKSGTATIGAIGYNTISCSATSNAGKTLSKSSAYTINWSIPANRLYATNGGTKTDTQIIVPQNVVQYGPYYPINKGCYFVLYIGNNLNYYPQGFRVYDNSVGKEFTITNRNYIQTSASYYVTIDVDNSTAIEFVYQNGASVTTTITDIKVVTNGDVSTCPSN